MLKEKPTATAEQLAEAAKLREEAEGSYRRAEESFQRSDTDGFLSQWASQITGQKLRRQADLLENGGHACFPVLCDADGNVLCDRIHRFKNQFNFGDDERWRLPNDLADKLGRKWIPVGRKSRVQKQLGLHEEDRWFPARATIAGSGTGLSGCASAYVTVERVYE